MNSVENKNAKVFDSDSIDYDVSICIITYNKENYIEATIDSVLKQDTGCKYEIVVGDNCSTDRTREILVNYWKSDSNKFCLIFNDENLGLTTNIYNTMRKAKGKYIVILYGDDYWLSNKKLQTQYEFLEKNPSYIGVTSSIANIYDGEAKPFKIFPSRKVRSSYCDLSMYLNGFDFPMAGVMFRNEVFTKEETHFRKMISASLYIDDLSFCILLLQLGPVFVIEEAMGAYRCFRDNSNSGNFNSVNSIARRNGMSIDLLNNLDVLTNNSLDLEVRYGLILASLYFALLKGKISKAEYLNVFNMCSDKYRLKKTMIKGLIQKVLLATIYK